MIFKVKEKPKIVTLQKIWDSAPHNAMTDLAYFQNSWFCSLRESDKHVKGKNGTIRIIASQEAASWRSVALFEEEGIDLRDPKLSLTPDGRLMLLVGGTIYGPRGKYISRQPHVAFSSDGINWTSLQPILSPHEWLWRVTWHQGVAYGVSYKFSNPRNPRKEWIVQLFKSQDGIHYSPIVVWNIPGHPNETTLRFNKNHEMVALVRRDGSLDNSAWIGISPPPYSDWEWYPTQRHLGGPNFLLLDDGTMWAGGRILNNNPYGFFEKTVLASMQPGDLTPILFLPSHGDSSYPGMVFHDEYLWMSYYSSHESNTAVYLAQIKLY